MTDIIDAHTQQLPDDNDHSVPVSHRDSPHRPPAGPRMWPFELVTFFAVAITCAFCARPLLEEWGFAQYFRAFGVGSYVHLIHGFPLRPLQGLPSALQWGLDSGGSLGWALGFLILLAARYVAARWAVSPIVDGPHRWVLATLGTLLPTWPAEWYLRYSAAHLSAVFFFVLVGAAIRCAPKLNPWIAAVGAIATLLLFTTYEALAVCVVVLPLVGLFIDVAGTRVVLNSKQAWLRVARAAVPVAAGLVLYGIYSYFATRIASGSGYDTSTVQHARIDSISAILSSTSDLYSTAYRLTPWIPAVFGLVLVCLVGRPISELPTSRARILAVAVLTAAIAALPLTAAPYAANAGFSTDPERVLFPVSVGFVVICIASLMRFGGRPVAFSSVLIPSCLLAAVFAVCLGPAITAYDYHEVQRNVLVNTVRIARAHAATSVLLVDYSGVLGDVYTFYPPSLEQALSAEGSNINLVLCTAVNVDRIDPVAQALQIPTTPRCDAPGVQQKGQFVINAVKEGTHVVLQASR